MPRDNCHLIFIHGLAKKPPPDMLVKIWVDSLDKDNPKPLVFGYSNSGIKVEQNVAYTLTYWADVFYGTDYETDYGSYEESIERADHYEGVERSTTIVPEDIKLPMPENEAEARFLEGFARKLGLDSSLPNTHEPDPEIPKRIEAGLETYALERVPLPMGVKKAIIRKAAAEAYYYLFNKTFVRSDGQVFETRRVIQDRLIEDLKKARTTASKVLLISHSMGTIIAYDCLRNRPDCPMIDGLITLGSPLGIDEVQDQLKANGASGVHFPRERLSGDWINVFDRLDVICAADPELVNDFPDGDILRIKDINEQNWGEWRHNISHYLKGPKLRSHVRRLGSF